MWLVVGLLLLVLLATTAALYRSVRCIRQLPAIDKGTVAFFHPFADGGGGGERVLWCAIKAVQQASPDARVVIYARDGVTASELVKDATSRFNITIDKTIEVVPMRRTDLILPEQYRRFTLVGQAVGSWKLAWEALQLKVPEVFIDTTGWAFTYPLAWLAGSRVACYVHYPTVSMDMLDRVWSRQASYNNDDEIAGSSLKTLAKAVYYQLFALAYGLAGAFARVVMVNSSWTCAHIRQIWWNWSDPLLVYPPCDTEQLQAIPLDRPLKRLFMVSVAQFRPEKNHRLQLEAFSMVLQRAHQQEAGQAVRSAQLKMVGSCRNEDDRKRLEALQQHAQELGIADQVEWHVNITFSELTTLLAGAVAGLHTMVDEHFGISVVEYMAAGVIPIANDSGGPREDIVVPEVVEEGVTQATGYLASTAQEYADAIGEVLAMDQRERLRIAAAAQRHASKFSTERFLKDFTAAVLPLLPRAQA